MFNAGIIARKRTRSLVAPTHVGTTTLSTTGNRTWPAGHASGDLALVYVETNTNDLTVTSSGWTKVPDSGIGFDGDAPGYLFIYYKFATSAAEAQFSATSTGGTPGMVMSAWRGVDPVAPFNATNFTSASITSAQTSNNRTSPAVTTTVPSCVVIAVRAMGHDCGAGSVGNYITTTRRGNSHSGGSVGGIIVGDVTQTSPATTGTFAWAWTDPSGVTTSGSGIGTLALQPP